MYTFNKMWGVITPEEARAKLDEQIAECRTDDPKNLEEQAMSLIGRDIYLKLIKGYTEKQWGKPCEELPPSIIKRIPLRFTYDNNYFNDTYQGIPDGGYTKLAEEMLRGIKVKTDCEYKSFVRECGNVAKKTVFTGRIDELFDYRFGKLEYRSLRFETEILPTSNYQGCAVVNYTDKEIPYTRIIEHKHFSKNNSEETVITKEYPMNIGDTGEPYYPINDKRNTDIFEKYNRLAKEDNNLIIGGRLAEYKYYDMDKVISSAIEAARRELE